MCDVILINSPISFEVNDLVIGDETWCPPLGVLYLAAVVEEAGYSVKVIDVRAENLKLEDIIMIVRKEKPRVIGISALTSGIRASVQCAERVKDVFGDSIKIGLGGSHVSADPEVIFRYPYFDFAVTGEGELTFRRIVHDVLEGKDIKGVIKGETPMDLDKLPLPARHLVDHSLYNIGQAKMAFMTTLRGCPFKCTFCSRPALSKSVRFRSVERVVDEMELLLNDFEGNFNFLDDTFTVDMQRTHQLCEEIIHRDLKAKWTCVTRPDRVDQDLLKIMASAGCQEIIFGVESGNERVRNDIIKKGIYDYQVRDAIRWCRKYSIDSILFLMLGFPTESQADLEDTVNYGLKVKSDGIGVHPTVPMPGSKIFQEAIEEGIINKNVIDLFIDGKLGRGFRDAWPIYVPHGMSKKILIKTRTRAHRKFYFRPGYLVKRFVRDLKSWTQLKNDFRIAIALIKYGRTETAIH